MKVIICGLMATASFTAYAQVKIGSPATPPHTSAQLEVQSPNKGLLLPRNANPQASIANPAAGLLAYNETSNSPQYYNGSSWVDMGGLYKEFPNAMVFRTTGVSSAINSVKVYNFTLPPNTKKIWMEVWSGGGAGAVLGNSPGNPAQYSGGDGGSYLSAVTSFTASNTTLIISVANASRNADYSWGNYSAVANAAGGTILALADSRNFKLNETNPATEPDSTRGGFIQFIPGEPGGATKWSFSTYYVNGVPGNVTFYQGGNGGNSAHAKGGEGVFLQTGINTGTIVTNNNGGRDGKFPGGGGGAGYNFPGWGAAGQVIIHY